MFEEMRKAYDTGAKRYWLLNVGDIKPGELGMKTFLDMAWDIDKFNFDNINNHQVDFLASIFEQLLSFRFPAQTGGNGMGI